MGNYKFKLSDMMPNAWFYKLRDTSRAKKQSNSTKKPLIFHPRRSVYHSSDTIRAEKLFNSPTNTKFSDTHFLDFPRKSSNRRSRRKTIYRPSPRLSTSSASIWERKEKSFPEKFLFSSSESSDDEFYKSPVSETESDSMDGHDLFNEFSSRSSSCNCRVTTSTTDIIIDVNAKSSVPKKNDKLKLFDSFSEIHLRPILTKPTKTRNKNPNFRNQSKKEQSPKNPPKQRGGNPSRKSISNSTRVKVKTNSPKIIKKKIQSCARKSVSSSKKSSKGSQRKSFSKSFAVVKSSIDPMKDFRDSMVEMIVENGISASKDLEELLACYLTLNLEEYHGVIVKAFEQIWFEMANLRM